MRLRLASVLAMSLAILASPSVAQVAEDAEATQAPDEPFLPAPISTDARAIVEGMNGFGADLYQQMRGEAGDHAISPASISTAFGLAYAGAKGETAREIASTLRYPTAVADFHAAFGELLGTMEIDRIGRRMTVNNAIWLQDGLVVLPEYEALVGRHYRAGLKRVDYKGDAEAARLKINDWVESKTNNKIRDLLKRPNITAGTRSVLVNTIYFKADWASPFEVPSTKIEDFTLRSGAKAKKPLMHQRAQYPYVEHEGVKAVGLPYRGGETDMIVLLPKSAKSFDAFEAGLTAPVLDGWLKRLNESYGQDTILTLPKFKIEKRYELKETLKTMGMIVPFSNQSDFSGMKLVRPASPDQEDWNLTIEQVIHQTFVEVEEKGTEAAAATAIVEVTITGAPRNPAPPPPPKIFRADKPFVFLIRDRRTQAVLFIGRYTGE